MHGRPITGSDADTYIANVHKHGLDQDVEWLLDVGRFPVGSAVLDVGCGTGAFVAALGRETQYARTVVGVEASPELARHARQRATSEHCSIDEADFLHWTCPGDWQPDTVVMSYFLHHCDEPVPYLMHAASCLPHGGRLYVVDRIAIDRTASESFPAFWEEHYRRSHEWPEEMPAIRTAEDLVAACAAAGFSFVQRRVCPHDRRAGTEGFPKTLMEFWRCIPPSTFPPVLIVSPAHDEDVDEIVDALEREALPVAARSRIPYSDELIRSIYSRCPWREPLLRFVNDVCPDRIATALRIAGDHTSPELLFRLGQFKKQHRDRWRSIRGPEAGYGYRAIILPFHVAEPYEAESLCRAIGMPSSGMPE